MSIPKEPEQVMKMRGGSVLGKRTILKSDHFPGCQNKRLTPQIDGAPNYRQVSSLRFSLIIEIIMIRVNCYYNCLSDSKISAFASHRFLSRFCGMHYLHDGNDETLN